MTVKQELLNGLAQDQIDKVRDCDNLSDLLQLAEDEGVELNDEQLDAVSGGACGGEEKDPEPKGPGKKYEE